MKVPTSHSPSGNAIDCCELQNSNVAVLLHIMGNYNEEKSGTS